MTAGPVAQFKGRSVALRLQIRSNASYHHDNRALRDLVGSSATDWTHKVKQERSCIRWGNLPVQDFAGQVAVVGRILPLADCAILGRDKNKTD
jgi:hypothetical protein